MALRGGDMALRGGDMALRGGDIALRGGDSALSRSRSLSRGGVVGRLRERNLSGSTFEPSEPPCSAGLRVENPLDSPLRRETGVGAAAAGSAYRSLRPSPALRLRPSGATLALWLFCNDLESGIGGPVLDGAVVSTRAMVVTARVRGGGVRVEFCRSRRSWMSGRERSRGAPEGI